MSTINPYEYTTANLAIRFELTCGKGCNFSAVMRERFLGVDRPEDEMVNWWGNEVDDEWIKQYQAKRIEGTIQ